MSRMARLDEHSQESWTLSWACTQNSQSLSFLESVIAVCPYTYNCDLATAQLVPGVCALRDWPYPGSYLEVIVKLDLHCHTHSLVTQGLKGKQIFMSSMWLWFNYKKCSICDDFYSLLQGHRKMLHNNTQCSTLAFFYAKFYHYFPSVICLKIS